MRTTYYANGKAFPVDERDLVTFTNLQGKTFATGYNHSRAWHAALAEPGPLNVVNESKPKED